MKKVISSFLAGLITGALVVFVLILVILPKQMIDVYESKLSFNETLDLIQESAVEHKWSVPHLYDLQATMNKHGYDVNSVKVFSLCKPEHAYKILSGKNERYVSAFMPCRVAVYEDDGKTYISMLNAGLFSRFMGKRIKNIMSEASKENKEILKPVIR